MSNRIGENACVYARDCDILRDGRSMTSGFPPAAPRRSARDRDGQGAGAFIEIRPSLEKSAAAQTHPPARVYIVSLLGPETLLTLECPWPPDTPKGDRFAIQNF